jgi:CRISPR-associated protein Csx16
VTTYFVSRHSGATEWAAQQGIVVDKRVIHLDVAEIVPGDIVMGTLPVHLAAKICARGGRYLHLTLEIPAEMRGRELTAAEMRDLGARIEEYRITSVP